MKYILSGTIFYTNEILFENLRSDNRTIKNISPKGIHDSMLITQFISFVKRNLKT